MDKEAVCPNNSTSRNAHQESILLRSILESPKGIIIFSLDKNYCYTAFTKSHKETMKKIWNADIEIGKNILDYITDNSDKDKAKTNFDLALKGQYITVREQYGDIKIFRSTWEDRYSPIFEDDGEIIGITVFVLDISLLIEAEENIRYAAIEKEKLLERATILNSIGEGVYGIDSESKCIFINPAALNELGYTEDEVIGANTHKLFHHHHYDGTEYNFEDCIIYRSYANNCKLEENTWLFRKDGVSFPAKIIATPIIKNYTTIGVVIAFNNISSQYEMEEKLRNANNELKHLATVDPLTQIYNRRYLEEKGDITFSVSQEQNRELSVIMFDIDYFKNVNDKYGHTVGDDLLISITVTVALHLRKTDIFARVGGEEFVILLPDVSTKSAVEISERIRKSVEMAYIIRDGNEIRCTISIGVSSITKNTKNLDELIKQADEMQYYAKRTGRNKVIWRI